MQSKSVRVIQRLLSAFIVIAFLTNSNVVCAAKSRKSPLRSFGDYAQIINPIIAGALASQEKGFGHYAVIYGETFVSMHAFKLIASSNKWKASKRPTIEGKKNRYDGMPSGHTASAWVAASYIRTFSEDYKYLSIPLYITAAVTGYSRIHAKEHTAGQVVAGAALAELVTFINSKLDWSNEYKTTTFYFGGDEYSASFRFNF